MVWLEICDDLGNTFYFDVHHVERMKIGRQWRHAVNGICGNGRDEVEVLVEPAGEGEVTFVDLAGARSRLMRGVDRGSLESVLIAAAREHCGLQEPARPYPHALHNCACHAHEQEPSWRSVS